MRAVTLTIAVSLAAGVADARAEGKTGLLVPFNPLGISDEEARRVQRWITSAASEVPGHRWLAPERAAHVLRQPRYRDCEGDPRCLGSVGRKVGADLVVAGDVGSLSGAYMVYLKLVEGERIVRSVNGVLDPRGAGLRQSARALVVRLLTPESFVGAIAVAVDVKDAWIYLDGQRAGKSPSAPLENVSVGTHALRVTHEAYRDFVRFVKVEFGKTESVDVQLSAFPVRAEQMKLTGPEPTGPLTDRELPWYRRWWAVAGVGAVIFAAATTTVAILASQSVSRDAEVVVRP